MDVARRAAEDFDSVIVTVAVNCWKTPSSTVEERVRTLRSAFVGDDRISVDSCQALVAPWARARGATSLVRGVRNWQDVLLEVTMTAVNYVLGRGLPTRLYSASPAYITCSSSAARARQAAAPGPSVPLS